MTDSSDLESGETITVTDSQYFSQQRILDNGCTYLQCRLDECLLTQLHSPFLCGRPPGLLWKRRGKFGWRYPGKKGVRAAGSGASCAADSASCKYSQSASPVPERKPLSTLCPDTMQTLVGTGVSPVAEQVLGPRLGR